MKAEIIIWITAKLIAVLSFKVRTFVLILAKITVFTHDLPEPPAGPFEFTVA